MCGVGIGVGVQNIHSSFSLSFFCWGSWLQMAEKVRPNVSTPGKIPRCFKDSC